MSKQTTVTTRDESAKSSVWQRPQLLRLEAGKAEIGASTNTDAINTAS